MDEDKDLEEKTEDMEVQADTENAKEEEEEEDTMPSAGEDATEAID